MMVLPALQDELTSATARLLATAASLTDADIAAPSLLPGWSRGHVLAHLAGNAHSHINLLTWARTGVKIPQYASTEFRAAEIESGAARSAAEHLAHLEDSVSLLAAAIAELPGPAWSAHVEGLRPPSHPAWYGLVRRLREVGLHHVDLDAGYGPADWPEVFVLRELNDTVRFWSREASTIGEIVVLDPGTGAEVAAWRDLGAGPAVRGAPADMLAWLTGRTKGAGVSVVPVGQSSTSGASTSLPEPPPWPAMPTPADLPATPPRDYR
ncbi:maleylpyruvate isomerase family mycothiol-dependent enzyme [Nonomuraea sp. NN258]|uniref:maleylpyruvate isomerase family mycothiol-dependent enzyme n=1 Tax=Nonomuraea antri TaxID=2730852 RepID=UPI001569184F|nr:maleylpyruvate isomerase family mycothiol-dependent enzyme [Nonomuraea antri]NRQ39406.1 maleylpyruvate isomerase family mycothiol-dependent enzyme [Nonomuraea antri]